MTLQLFPKKIKVISRFSGQGFGWDSLAGLATLSMLNSSGFDWRSGQWIFRFQYISNKMQLYTVYLYLETALHISGSTSTHHQERIQLYLQHLVLVTPLLLPVAIVEELEPV